MSDWLRNITDKNVLQDNLTFVSLYIAVYENMVDYVVSSLKSFLCDFGIKNGKEYYVESEEYWREIKNRAVDVKGNKNTVKASFLWLVDNEAITKEEYKRFLQIKELRNRYAHELASIICQGIYESEVKLFFDMFSLYRKIGQWYFVNVEAAILGIELPEDPDEAEIHTGADVVFGMVLEVLYNGKSELYKELIEELEGKSHEE